MTLGLSKQHETLLQHVMQADSKAALDTRWKTLLQSVDKDDLFQALRTSPKLFGLTHSKTPMAPYIFKILLSWMIEKAFLQLERASDTDYALHLMATMPNPRALMVYWQKHCAPNMSQAIPAIDSRQKRNVLHILAESSQEKKAVAASQWVLKQPQAGALLPQTDMAGNTPLHVTVIRGHRTLTTTLLQNDSKKASLQVANKYKHRPLHSAVCFQRQNIAMELLQADQKNVATLTQLSSGQRNIVHMAVITNATDLLTAIQKHSPSAWQTCLQQRDALGFTPLDYATTLQRQKMRSVLSQSSAQQPKRTQAAPQPPRADKEDKEDKSEKKQHPAIKLSPVLNLLAEFPRSPDLLSKPFFRAHITDTAFLVQVLDFSESKFHAANHLFQDPKMQQIVTADKEALFEQLVNRRKGYLCFGNPFLQKSFCQALQCGLSLEMLFQLTNTVDRPHLAAKILAIPEITPILKTQPLTTLNALLKACSPTTITAQARQIITLIEHHVQEACKPLVKKEMGWKQRWQQCHSAAGKLRYGHALYRFLAFCSATLRRRWDAAWKQAQQQGCIDHLAKGWADTNHHPEKHNAWQQAVVSCLNAKRQSQQAKQAREQTLPTQPSKSPSLTDKP